MITRTAVIAHRVFRGEIHRGVTIPRVASRSIKLTLPITARLLARAART